ncbi:MAG: N-acetylmuramoyl-L-alanine amidase [Acholeplasmatales bacterium]|nr:N-acetylmuramoyl-L-alanine amidase [Acholeplasmatales bacterium]
MKKAFFYSLVICIISLFSNTVSVSSISNNTIVIDPGHGGMDTGCSYGDIYESDMNLDISLILEDIFISNGYNVILTRKNKDSLCEDRFIKKEDMNKRIEIINNSNAIMCLSIHLNMFSDSQYRGAQVFYSNANDKNKYLAENVQNSIRNMLNNTDRVEMLRDNIYLLNKSIIPTIIIECGFLSNENERYLLINKDYQTLLAYSIYYGATAL